MLFCLSHNTVSSSNNKDSTVHLSSTCDHVLYIISMTWAVNMSVMSLFCLILNMSCRDCDTSFSLFWSLINVLKIYCCVTSNSSCKCLCDSSSKCCLTMIYVTDSTNVTMRFSSFKLFFSHF